MDESGDTQMQQPYSQIIEYPYSQQLLLLQLASFSQLASTLASYSSRVVEQFYYSLLASSSQSQLALLVVEIEQSFTVESQSLLLEQPYHTLLLFYQARILQYSITCSQQSSYSTSVLLSFPLFSCVLDSYFLSRCCLGSTVHPGALTIQYIQYTPPDSAERSSRHQHSCLFLVYQLIAAIAHL